MTADEAVLASLMGRLSALDERLDFLLGHLSSDLPRARLIRLFQFYPIAARAVANAIWSREADPVSRQQQLRPVLSQTLNVGSAVETWLETAPRSCHSFAASRTAFSQPATSSATMVASLRVALLMPWQPRVPPSRTRL